MADLTQYQPQVNLTVDAIFDWHKRNGDSEPERGYLGASIIGHECERYLWYTFRNCIKRDFSGRLYRLFETGDLAEPRFIKELRGIGCEVHEVGPDGKQFEVNAFEGHFSGHMDGVALGVLEAPQTWHVLEFKTHNDKSFQKLPKEGVKKSKPMHYAQMMVYMGLTKMTRALYLAVNKNTDELYSERIKYNSQEFNGYMQKAERIIFSQQPPERMASRPDDFRCRFCDAKELCWPGGNDIHLPRIDERMCCHATPEKNGTWSHVKDCSKGHLLMPCFVHFADAIDAGDDWIEFKNKEDGTIWRHGNGYGMWSAEQLIANDIDFSNSPTQEQKIPFDVPVLPLTEQYSYEFSELLWSGDPSEVTAILPSLGLQDIINISPNQTEDSDLHTACEYKNVNNQDILIVIYKEGNHAAIWKGMK
jgi:hypothetical protein